MRYFTFRSVSDNVHHIKLSNVTTYTLLLHYLVLIFCQLVGQCASVGINHPCIMQL